MYTCGIRINAKLVKEGSFHINAKLEELKEYHNIQLVLLYLCNFLYMMGFFCNHIQYGKLLMGYHDDESEEEIY